MSIMIMVGSIFDAYDPNPLVRRTAWAEMSIVGKTAGGEHRLRCFQPEPTIGSLSPRRLSRSLHSRLVGTLTGIVMDANLFSTCMGQKLHALERRSIPEPASGGSLTERQRLLTSRGPPQQCGTPESNQGTSRMRQ